MAKLTMVKALNLALHQEMERDPDVLVIGEDVGVDGGVFRVTEDLHRVFGGTRVIDSPLAEAGIIGASVGMAIYGLKPVCEIQFSGFAFQCFHQIENHTARYRQRTQGRFHCQMVMRMPYGGGVRALEHHSESEEQFYAHIPGLKMVIPSGPRTARALLVAAIRDPDPVVFFEAKALYHAAKEEVPGRAGAPGDRARPRGPRGAGSHPRRLRRDAPRLPGGRGGPARRGRRGGRGHRPPHHLAPRSGHPDARPCRRRAAR